MRSSVVEAPAGEAPVITELSLVGESRAKLIAVRLVAPLAPVKTSQCTRLRRMTGPNASVVVHSDQTIHCTAWLTETSVTVKIGDKLDCKHGSHPSRHIRDAVDRG